MSNGIKFIKAISNRKFEYINDLEHLQNLKNGIEVPDIGKIQSFFNSMIDLINFETDENEKEKIKKLVIYWIDYIIDNNIFIDKYDIQKQLFEIFKLTDTYPLLINFEDRFLDNEESANIFDVCNYKLRVKNNKILNNTQYDIRNQIKQQKNIIFSAPTSYGKSTIVLETIKEDIKSKKIKRLIFLLPTKALINEYRRKIKKNIINIEIIENPYFKDDYDSLILLFTQERFLIYNSINKNASFDYVIVDEAQILYKLKDDRTIILAKSLSILSNKHIPFIFLLPYFSEPYVKLISKFVNIDFYGNDINNLLSFVSNNYYILSLENKNVIRYNCTKDSGIKNISQETLLENVNYGKKRLDEWSEIISLNLYKFINKKEKSLIYVTSVEQLRRTAEIFYKNIKTADFNKTPRFNALIKYIRENIHPEFEYIKYLNSGIAMHFGDMDPFVKRQVEILFNESEDINIIICTSTLLRGVNLNAKNLFLFYAKNSMLSDVEFKNLLGRTARLDLNIQGNVYMVTNDINDIKTRSIKLYRSNEPTNMDIQKEIKQLERDCFKSFSERKIAKYLSDINVDSELKNLLPCSTIQYDVENHDYFITNKEIESANTNLDVSKLDYYEELLKNLGDYDKTLLLTKEMSKIYNWSSSNDFIVKYRLSSAEYITTVVCKVIKGYSILKIVSDLLKCNDRNNIEEKGHKLVVCKSLNNGEYVRKIKIIEEHKCSNMVCDFNIKDHLNLLIYSCLFETQKIIEFNYKNYIQDLYYRVKRFKNKNIETVEQFLDYTTIDPKKIILIKNGIIDQFVINELVKSKYSFLFRDKELLKDKMKELYMMLDNDDPLKYGLDDII